MFANLLSSLNWLHVLVATVAYFAIGAIWYSPVLFAKPWQKFVKVDMNNADNKKGLGAIMFTGFVLTFIICFGLAIMYSIIPVEGTFEAIKFGLFFSVCFCATAISISFIYEKRPLGLHLIDNFYHIIGFIAASIVLVLWK